MSITTNRGTPLDTGRPAELGLARLLSSPALARVVPQLPPETLHQLVRHCGLDACGELLASATPAQLTALFDLDLWRGPQPGCDEQFDAGRFGEWLDALIDAGEAPAARIVAAVDARTVIAGLSRYVRVFDPGTFEPVAQSDDEAPDRDELMRSEGHDDLPECEVGGYLVRARRPEAWDAVVALLVALDTEQPDRFHAVMQGCRRLSNSRPEADGLDDLLLTPEQHLHDTALGREERRARRGYATPADARAFLQMARQPRAPSAINPIAAAYFHAAEADEAADDIEAAGGSPADAPEEARRRNGGDAARRDEDEAAAIAAVVELLAEADAAPGRPRALLGAGEETPAAEDLPTLKRLLAGVLRHDQAAYLARNRELAFLANVLLAGSSVQSRPFTPREASDAAASVCNLGLERWPTAPPNATGPATAPRYDDAVAALPEAFLADHDLVAAFERGWAVLYEEVSLFAADRLAAILAGVRCADADIRRELRALERRLAARRETPWLARGAADVLATLDMAAWVGVLGLLDECPILPEALTAVVTRRTEPIRPDAFRFIATTAQIGEVHAFLRALPAVLAS